MTARPLIVATGTERRPRPGRRRAVRSALIAAQRRLRPDTSPRCGGGTLTGRAGVVQLPRSSSTTSRNGARQEPEDMQTKLDEAKTELLARAARVAESSPAGGQAPVQGLDPDTL